MSTFSTSSRQKRLKTRSFLHLTSKCASRHNGVHFFDTFSTSEPPKVVRDRQFLTLFTSKCASRHNGVHFFDISTSKSGPELVCFVRFDLEMCFAPQRRALFRHRNFQKWSEHGVFCTFWLGNVLRATTACTFSTSQLPKVVRSWCVLYILTWKCASRHNGVHFFDIATSKSGPTLVCFVHFDLEMCFAPQRRALFHLSSGQLGPHLSEPTFRPSGATNHWKNTVNRDFPTFSRICIFFLLIFSLLTLLTSAFQLSILSEVSLLNFLRWKSRWNHMCHWKNLVPIKCQGLPVENFQSVVGLVETCRRWHQRRGNNGSVEAVSSGLTEAAKKMVMPLGGKLWFSWLFFMMRFHGI